MVISLNLQVIVVVVVFIAPSPCSPQGSPIANCLQQTNGSYNIGCPNHPSQDAECLLEGPNGTSPYARLCDGVIDCVAANPVDEGNRGGVNGLLDCELQLIKCCYIRKCMLVRTTMHCHNNLACWQEDDLN